MSLSAMPAPTVTSSNASAFLVFVALFVLGALISSAFGGLETACYSLSRLHLFLREHEGDHRAVTLHRELRNMPRLITTLLIGNNLGNYLCSFALTAILSNILHFSDPASIAFQALLLTPFLFLFGETIPKELCRTRAESIIYPAAPILRFVRALFSITGLIPLVSLFSNAIVHLFRTSDSQSVISARLRMSGTLHEGVGSGLISLRQMNMVERFLEAESVPVRRLMTPWKQALHINSKQTPQQFLMRNISQHHTIYPLVDADTHEVMGVIAALDIIGLSEDDKHIPFSKLAIHQPVTIINPDNSLPHAIRTMRSANADLALVAPPPSPAFPTKKPLGIITKKDLLEPLITPHNTTP